MTIPSGGGLGAPAFGAADLTDCDREPIHTPGSIQPHGCLLTASARDWIIGHASENLHDFFDKTADEAIGSPAEALFGKEGLHTLRNCLQHAQATSQGERFFNISSPGWRSAFDIAMHVADGRIVMEFEPRRDDEATVEPLSLVKTVTARLAGAEGLKRYCDVAARYLRVVTGFDRVMVYRFADDDSGEVVAEAGRSDLESYLGLHYPATDIPAQARALYLRNPIRAVVDVEATPVPISPVADLSGAPLDCSYVGLRSVSPIHLEYLRNMGVRASLSISIIRDNRLWGLFACHHMAPKRLTPELRSACELFCQLFSLQIDAKERADDYEAERRAREALDALMARLTPEASFFDNLGMFRSILMDAIAADGVAIYAEGRYESEGMALSPEHAPRLANLLNADLGSEVFATDHIAGAIPDLKGNAVAGVIAIPISRSPRDYLLFFRRELPKTVTWAGDPNKAAEAAPDARLTPRKSFEAWTETVRDHSAPWGGTDLRIAEALRVALLEAILRRTDALERERKQTQERQSLLIAELNHRLKNMLTLVRSMVRGGRDSEESIQEFIESLLGRIEALAQAYDQATGRAKNGVSLATLLGNELRPYERDGGPRVRLEGDAAIGLESRALASLALVIHELATNAAKYGALSAPSGALKVAWRRLEAGGIEISWAESGGPAVREPAARGFGSGLIARTIPHELGGEAEVTYDPAGLRARFVVPERFLSASALEEEEDADGAGAAPAPIETPTEFVALLVEDSAVIALDLDDLLRQAGARDVVVAPDVRSALAELDRHVFDVALLDVDLGAETSGPIAEALEQRGVAFVFSSGYDEDARIKERFPAAPMLSKPYSADSLKSVLMKALSGDKN